MALWVISHSPTIMSLVQNIYSMAARHQFSVSFKHILGHSNTIADALSRLKNDRFRILAPLANEEPTSLPNNVWLILFTTPIVSYFYLDISSSNSPSIQHARNQTTSLTTLHVHLNDLLNNYS